MSQEQNREVDWRTNGEKLWDCAQTLNLSINRSCRVASGVIFFELSGIITADMLEACDGSLQDVAENLMREFFARQRPDDREFDGDDDGESWKKGGAE